MAPPFMYHRPADGEETRENALMRAARDGNLAVLKGIVKSFIKGNGDRSVIFSFNMNGLGVLHFAACTGHLEVCKYLVELGGDVNAPGRAGGDVNAPGRAGGDVNAPGTGPGGVTPFMASAQSGDVPTVQYFLDHGGDLMKADDKGYTVLHHAASSGSCHVTEFLLSKGVPVDIDCGRGTPLYAAATNEQDKTLKILLDHHANPNIMVSDTVSPLMSALVYRSLKCMKLLIKAGADVNIRGSFMNPLLFATSRGGYTNFIQFLLKAGADPNIPDDLGRLTIELAAKRDCMEEVEMLFPLTSPIPNVPNWSIEGVMFHAKFGEKKAIRTNEKFKLNFTGDLDRRKGLFKSQADTAFKYKDYKLASKCYDLAIAHGESATLYANRSLCKLLMGDGDGALSDALKCRMLRPKWAKACFRHAAAHMLLKEYKQACDALLDAQKLDPGNAEIENELRKARELMENSSPGDGEQ